jgi:dihydroorotate dehydrogenase (NAD+) catalytic subunit
MAYECARAVKIPVIGCGGISNASDAIEFLLAGCCAIQVGTATFIDPNAMISVLDGLNSYCEHHGIDHVSDLIGGLILPDEPLESASLRFL